MQNSQKGFANKKVEHMSNINGSLKLYCSEKIIWNEIIPQLYCIPILVQCQLIVSLYVLVSYQTQHGLGSDLAFIFQT